MNPEKHYLLRDHALWFPLLAIALNVVAISIFAVQLHSMRQNLQIEFASTRAPQQQANTPIVIVETGPTLRIDDQRLATFADLEFRLTARAASTRRVLIRVGPGVSSEIFAQALEVCSRAGFTNAAIEMLR